MYRVDWIISHFKTLQLVLEPGLQIRHKYGWFKDRSREVYREE